jgi:hypothetical protein
VEVTEEGLALFFEVVLRHMNEGQRRVVAGAAAEMLGRDGRMNRPGYDGGSGVWFSQAASV